MPSATGDADASNWPGTTAVGAGFRGGSWAPNTTGLRVSDRLWSASPPEELYSGTGGTGVRNTRVPEAACKEERRKWRGDGILISL